MDLSGREMDGGADLSVNIIGAKDDRERIVQACRRVSNLGSGLVAAAVCHNKIEDRFTSQTVH